MKLQAGRVLGRWKIDRVLSFGKPMLASAHDVDDHERTAVLKVLERSPSTERSIDSEAVALSVLHHRSLPALIETGRADSFVFTALEPFSTDSLADRMVEGGADWKLACTWLHELATGLQYLHQEGWVHRSLSPDCLYVGPEDQIWILGLHSAVLEAEEPQRAALNQANLAYVAPEVLVDPAYHAARADLYAFGCIAFELLAKESAFPAATWAEHAEPKQLLLEWKTRITELDPGPDQPDWVRSLVRKCTHPHSEQRLPDVDTVVAWLEGARGSWEISKATATPVAVPRGQEPTLNPQPTYFDQEELALAIARHTAILQVEDYRAKHDVLVWVAAAVGCAAGLCLSLLSVIYLEISLLG